LLRLTGTVGDARDVATLAVLEVIGVKEVED
jgi:hypothetical protein